MRSICITDIKAQDKRYTLKNGAGSDAVHTKSIYGYAVCVLKTDAREQGVGLAFTLGEGNHLICEAIETLGRRLKGKEINELMENFGDHFNAMAEDPEYRWLGPHKGVVHLALAAITNACYDLWAKSREVPLWKLLNDLSPESLLNTLDFSYVEDVICKEEARAC